MRNKGSRNTLIRIDYDVIGQLAAIAGDTAKQYAHRGQYDPRDLGSLMSWVNSRRQRQGKPLIGIPIESASDSDVCAEDDSDVTFVPVPITPGLLNYDPMTGCIAFTQ